jgi:hypothetical protein
MELRGANVGAMSLFATRPFAEVIYNALTPARPKSTLSAWR